MTKRDQVWARWVRSNRKAKNWSRRALAATAGIDASYITLIERDGYVPSRSRVRAIGAALGNPQRALIYAGYIPEEDRRTLINAIDSQRMLRLDPQVQQFISIFSGLQHNAQRKALGVLVAHLGTT